MTHTNQETKGDKGMKTEIIKVPMTKMEGHTLLHALAEANREADDDTKIKNTWMANRILNLINDGPTMKVPKS